MTDRAFRLAWACLLALGLLALGACGSREPESALTVFDTQEPGLAFETIELTEYGARYEGKDPKVEVVGELDAIHSLWHQVSPKLMAELQRMDYDRYLVLILFHGRRNDTPYHPGAEIRRVTYSHDVLDLCPFL